NLALSLIVGHQPRAPQAKFAGAFSGFDKSGGTEVCPVKVGLLEQRKHVTMSHGDSHPRLWKRGRIDQLHAGSNFEASRSAHDDEAAHNRRSETGEKGSRDIGDQAGIGLGWRVRSEEHT